MDSQLSARASAARTADALEAGWFAELCAGSGAAQGMPPALRTALTVATVDGAREAVAIQRAAVEAEKERARSDAARASAERARVVAAAQRREREVRARRRAALDWRLVFTALLVSVTVLVPWLVGRYLLRDTSLHPRDAGVYDITARDTGSYFLADWLGGIGVWLLVSAAIIVLGSWRRRLGTVSVAIVFAVLSVAVTLPASTRSWEEAEGLTVARLAHTSYPFSEHWATCGSEEFQFEESGTQHRYQIHTARTVGAEGCNRLVVYDGWREIGRVTLPDGETLSMNGGFFRAFSSWEVWRVEGDTLADTGVVTFTAAGDTIGLLLATPNEIWRASTEGADIEAHETGILLVTVGVNQPDSRVDALDAVTGGLLWTTTCPESDQVIASPARERDEETIALSCQGPWGLGDTGRRNYALGLDGALE